MSRIDSSLVAPSEQDNLAIEESLRLTDGATIYLVQANGLKKLLHFVQADTDDSLTMWPDLATKKRRFTRVPIIGTQLYYTAMAATFPA